MTTNQILQLEIDLVPDGTSINNLVTNHDIRNQLVQFFYKCKHNYEKYQKNLKVCSVNITWSRGSSSSIITTVKKYDARILLPGNLAALLYKHILIEINTTLITSNFSSYIRESLRIDGLLKQQALRYFNNKNCCSSESINYNQYHFMQLNKYIGNR